MAFTDWTSFRNFVFEFCNRRNQYIQNNFDHFLTAGTWRFIKSCLPLGATQEFFLRTSDAEGTPVFIRSGNYLKASFVDLRNYTKAYPYAIDRVRAYISYNTGINEYNERITLPYWKSLGFWDISKLEWFPPFWTFSNNFEYIEGMFIIVHSPYPTSFIVIRAIWLPFNIEDYTALWYQYAYEIAKFTYYEVLLALSEWDEANLVWQECMKIAQEMRQQHGVKKLIIPYEQIDYLNPQAQVVVKGGGGGE